MKRSAHLGFGGFAGLVDHLLARTFTFWGEQATSLFRRATGRAKGSEAFNI